LYFIHNKLIDHYAFSLVEGFWFFAVIFFSYDIVLNIFITKRDEGWYIKTLGKEQGYVPTSFFFRRSPILKVQKNYFPMEKIKTSYRKYFFPHENTKN